jgi:hypothetical protein
MRNFYLQFEPSLTPLQFSTAVACAGKGAADSLAELKTMLASLRCRTAFVKLNKPRVSFPPS